MLPNHGRALLRPEHPPEVLHQSVTPRGEPSSPCTTQCRTGLVLPSPVHIQPGQHRPWSDGCHSGYPGDSVPVKRHLAGYKQVEAGCAEKAAIPCSDASLATAVQGVWAAALEHPGAAQCCCLLRQAAEVQLGYSAALYGRSAGLKHQLVSRELLSWQP